MYKLKITLKSDLCVSSGFSYAGIIDSDSVFDENGLPYIPARRIKGCLKESVNLINIPKEYDDIIFGITGNDGSKGVIINNAYLPYYDEISNNLNNIDSKYKEYLNTQNILDKYSTIKSQTSIDETGVAKEGSLRIIRTINHFDPILKNNMIFYADVSFDNLPKHIDKNNVHYYLNKLVKATRNIGLQRNRGLGSIKMELIESENTKAIYDIELSDNVCGIEYVIKNTSPLILSDIDINSTISYIKGSNVLGSLAKEYLKNNEINDEFNDLFLNGKVIYSNVYKAELYNDIWYRSYPAPLNINKLKKTKKLVDLSFDNKDKDEVEDYKMANGNQAKKLKNKNIIKYDDGYKVIETINEVVYHHSHTGTNKKGDAGLLYYLDAVSKNQYFKGYIYGDKESLKKILKLLVNAKLSFGKSKTAQYGCCELVGDSIKEIKQVKYEFKKDDVIQVKMLSDCILINDIGNYVTNYNEAKDIILKQLKLNTYENEEMSFVKNSVVTGYLGTWNLQKSQVPAIKAGSVFTYKLKEELSSDIKYIGERNLDGFGEILIEKKHDSFRLNEHIDKKENKETPNGKTKEILKDIIIKDLYLKLIKDKQSCRRISITPSLLGRLTLMLVESANETKDPKEILIKLNCRIASIKASDKQKEIYNYLKNILNFNINETIRVDLLAKDYTEYALLKEISSEDEAVKLIGEMCVPLLREMLSFEKYSKKEK